MAKDGKRWPQDRRPNAGSTRPDLPPRFWERPRSPKPSFTISRWLKNGSKIAQDGSQMGQHGLTSFKMPPLEHPKSCSRRGAVQILQNLPISSPSNLFLPFPALSKLQNDARLPQNGTKRAPNWLQNGQPNDGSTRLDLPPAISGASKISMDFFHVVRMA